MDISVIALSINPRPLSALELKLSGLIMESRVDTAGDNQIAHVIISYNHADLLLIFSLKIVLPITRHIIFRMGISAVIRPTC